MLVGGEGHDTGELTGSARAGEWSLVDGGGRYGEGADGQIHGHGGARAQQRPRPAQGHGG